ncbi:hypothetical protein LTR84_010605 [Exophiala bonariae]|uniref:Uncharacterized protein n=1 Tax=Exophiala bonariae TaxID=1690606 RepID=A0AAV9MVH6_9EURO|nr:hypothetical protein LTR84_010605 [Exophiala bonariae]
MKCHLNPILAYCILMSGRESVDRKLLTKVQGDKKLFPIMDAYLAVKAPLEYYFRDRLAESAISEYQQDFLFKAILSHPTANQAISLKAVKGFVKSLANYGRFPLQRDICFLMRNTNCWQTASDLSVALMNHVSPELPHDAEWQPCCKVSDEKVGLLFHWAQVTCAPSCRCAHGSIRPTADYSMVLQLMMVHGADLHAKCYWGGTVFQALLDSSIERRDDHGPLDRKAKFLALTENGFDPTILAENGHDALQSAILAFNNGTSRSLYEIDSIIGYLRFYDIYAKWPEEEHETLDLVQSAIRWPTETDCVQRNSQQSTQGSVRQPEEHAVQESTDLYGDDREADAPEGPHSPEPAPTARRRRTQSVEIDKVDSDDEPDDPLPRPLSQDLQKNVSKMADAVEDILKLRAAEATVTMNKWKTTLASNWKKLDLGSVSRPKLPAEE